MNTLTTSSPEYLSDPTIMLETLHLAYQFALDVAVDVGLGDEITNRVPRLSVEMQREVGRRLALYWDMKGFTSPTGSRGTIDDAY